MKSQAFIASESYLLLESGVTAPGISSDHCRLTICEALAFLGGRISLGWGRSKRLCNVIEIAVKHLSPRSPKPHTKR
jgi:hypothetical protein